GYDVNISDQALANHANGVANVVLRIDEKLVREDVEHFAIFGKRNVAGGIDGASDILTLDVARPVAQRDAAAAVHAAHVIPGDADERLFHWHVGDAFGFLNSAANRADRGIEIHDKPFAQALGFSGAQRKKLYEVAVDFGDEDGSLGAANVEPNQ